MDFSYSTFVVMHRSAYPTSFACKRTPGTSIFVDISPKELSITICPLEIPDLWYSYELNGSVATDINSYTDDNLFFIHGVMMEIRLYSIEVVMC